MAIVMVVSIGLFDGRAPTQPSNGRIRPEGRLRLDRLPAMAKPAFFACRDVAAFLARQKSRLPPSSAADNGYTGSVKTLTLNVKAKFVATEKENDKAPDYRIFAGATEFGAAWKKTSGAGREYLSVKLDDPSFPAPIFASLFATEGGDAYALIWSRRSTD